MDRATVLVTGCSGLIGSALCRRLAPSYRVVGMDLHANPDSAADQDLSVDFTDDQSVERGLQQLREGYGDRLAAVIHLVAYYDFTGAPSPKYDQVTVGGTRRLLEGLRTFEVEQFVFSGTMLAYRPKPPGQRIREDDAVEATWPYPESKLTTEQVIRELHGPIPYVLLRIAGVYDDTGHSVPLANQIQRIYERWFTGHFFPGDLSHGQALLHLDDLADALARLVDRRESLPAATELLLGEPETVSYGELQAALGRRLLGQPYWTVRIPKFLAKLGLWLQWRLPLDRKPFIRPPMVDIADDNYELDLRRAHELLDWTPEHRVAAALPKIVGALHRDPLAWYQHNKLQPPRWLKEQQPEPAGKLKPLGM